jgi:hypothetical protein
MITASPGLAAVRGQFLACGRCWIRTNLAGIPLGAMLRKPALTKTNHYSTLLIVTREFSTSDGL